MKRKLILALLGFFLIGCYDKAYGPKVRNEGSQDIRIIIQYENSESKVALIPPCRTVFLGRRDDSIKKITIENDARIIKTLESEDVRELVAVESKLGLSNWVWVIDSSGLIGKKEHVCPGG